VFTYVCVRPKKLLHAVQDETYQQGLHELHETQKMADEVCRYDLDDLDCDWLDNYNKLRKEHGNASWFDSVYYLCMYTLQVVDFFVAAVSYYFLFSQLSLASLRGL